MIALVDPTRFEVVALLELVCYLAHTRRHHHVFLLLWQTKINERRKEKRKREEKKRRKKIMMKRAQNLKLEQTGAFFEKLELLTSNYKNKKGNKRYKEKKKRVPSPRKHLQFMPRNATLSPGQTKVCQTLLYLFLMSFKIFGF